MDGNIVSVYTESALRLVTYTYDDLGNLIGVKPATYVSATAYATVNDAESVDYTYNSKLQLDKKTQGVQPLGCTPC